MKSKMLKTTLSSLFASILLCTQVQAEPYNCYSATNWDNCGCTDRFWIDAEYLYWQIQDSPENTILVVEGPAASPSFDGPVVGVPGYTTVLGGKNIDNNWRSGGKFGMGYWFDDTRHYGIEGNYFFLPNTSKSSSVTATGAAGTNSLFIPFYDVTTDLDSSVVIATPLADAGGVGGPLLGTATLKVVNSMQGAELNGLAVFPCGCAFNMSALVGLRYWNFNENLTFSVDSPYIPPHAVDIFEVTDKFLVKNNFYGGQIGCGLDYSCDCFSFNAKVKVALGAMCEELKINGSTFTNDFNTVPFTGTAVSYEGGMFSQVSNIGTHTKTEFAVIPEVNVNFGYQVTECFRIKVGYTFLYVSNMLYAGQQLSQYINPTQSVFLEDEPAPVLTGTAAPSGRMKTSTLWVQGVNAGFEFQF